MSYTKEELDAFEANTDFTIVCDSPLEIEHIDGSSANGTCAVYIIDGYFSSLSL